jgi:hypothetical protein
MRLPGQDTGRRVTSTVPDVKAYRAAVTDLSLEIAALTSQHGLTKVEKVLLERIAEPQLVTVLAATPTGLPGAMQRLLFELRQYRPNSTSSPMNLNDLVRIVLSSQIDAMWWGRTRPFETDADLLRSSELVDLDHLRRDGPLGFQYRRQPVTLTSRVARAVSRRMWPDRTPPGAGLRFSHARPEAVALLDQLAADLATVAPAGTPAPWITSLTRSVAHQHHLRSLGYPAMLPSAHCVGYAVDVEMEWFRQFRADRALACLLMERQECGDANIIDEGRVWHICISPTAAPRLREEFESGHTVRPTQRQPATAAASADRPPKPPPEPEPIQPAAQPHRRTDNGV